MVVKIEVNYDSGNMRISTKLRKGQKKPDLGDIRIIKPATQDILDVLHGRRLAYFIASTTNDNLKIYCETKAIKEW